MNKMLAFLKRDWQSMLSYRFRFILQLIGILLTVLFLFFVGKTFSGGFSIQLERYGNDYFAFAILGMALSTFVSTGLYSFSSQIRNAQVQGTLEALLITPNSVYTILIGNSLWSFLKSFFESFFLIGVSILILKLSVDPGQVALLFISLVLTFGAFISVGLVSASFTLVFKQGNPINAFFGASSYFLGGLLFPVEVMPKGIQWISKLLPLTHSSKIVREILLVSPQDRQILTSLLFLFLFTALVGPLSLYIFHHALKRAKKDGSLVQY
ncbi:ABC transporter permease [Spirochaeta isovalerica]|uniref:Transport permease protein n=1 Tax=Spirochaeta isovalerica TaxID=150 RepID=A0A841R9K1_9SPIO|nr:ABC transporter permease [Spirochaeta isovalerica]MBB6479619.1 ABC-2 type transport system permease protein [Spirochaeta isovalerica]